MIGFYDIYDHPNQAGRRKKLTAFLRTAHRELVEKIFVDTAKHIAFSLGEHRAIKNLDQFGEQIGLEADIVFRQSAFQQFLPCWSVTSFSIATIASRMLAPKVVLCGKLAR